MLKINNTQAHPCRILLEDNKNICFRKKAKYVLKNDIFIIRCKTIYFNFNFQYLFGISLFMLIGGIVNGIMKSSCFSITPYSNSGSG